MKTRNGSTPKTSPVESHETSELEEVWKILARDVVLTMDDWVDTKERKRSP